MTLAVALLLPLDTASDALFSSHVVQHLLLIAIAAPLLVLGRPVVPLVWALPRGASSHGCALRRGGGLGAKKR